VLAVPAGRTLVVADLSPFTLHYGFDDWDPGPRSPSGTRQGLGLGLFGVTLTPADLAGRASLQFVRPVPGRPLGRRPPPRRRAGCSRAGHAPIENAGPGAASGNRGCGGAYSAWPALDRDPPGVRLALGLLGPAATRAPPNRRLAYSR